MIMSATRFITAKHADRIVVLVDGCLVQDGSYADLSTNQGPFKDHMSK
jgi:ABC-type multidrug transport system fused ATPase/permease subunit